MSEFELAPLSSLGSRAFYAARGATGAPVVTLEERTDVAIYGVMPRRGQQERLSDRVREEFRLELPLTGRVSHAGSVTFVWAGRSRWSAICDRTEEVSFGLRLKASCAGAATVINQSDGLTILRISGPRARDVLSKGVQIDLHPSAFGPDDAAMTVVSYIGVQFWQIDKTPAYDLAVFHSFARAFWDWIVNAAAEFDMEKTASAHEPYSMETLVGRNEEGWR